MSRLKFKVGDLVTYTKYLPKMDRIYFANGPRRIVYIASGGAPYVLNNITWCSFEGNELKLVKKNRKDS
jgi:hypothetical protein